MSDEVVGTSQNIAILCAVRCTCVFASTIARVYVYMPTSRTDCSAPVIGVVDAGVVLGLLHEACQRTSVLSDDIQ